MTDEKAKGKGPRNAAPKQRITLVKQRERKAADIASGWVEERGKLPPPALELLADFDAEAIACIQSALSLYRVRTEVQEVELTSAEAAEQCHTTAGAIRAVLDRMESLDASVDACAELIWSQNGGLSRESAPMSTFWAQRVAPMLEQVAWTFELAAQELPASKAGRKPAIARANFLESVTTVVLTRTTGRGRKTAARELALSIAEACGISTPHDERNRRRATGQK